MEKPPPVPQKDVPILRVYDSSADENSTRRLVSTELQSRSAAADSITRSRTAPIPASWADAKRAASVSPSPVHQQKAQAVVPPLPARAPASSHTLPPPSIAIPPRSTSGNAARPIEPVSQAPAATSSVFDDLISLSNGNTQPQPPLQMQSTSYQNSHLGNPWAALGTQQQALISPMMMMTNTAATSYFQQSQPQHQPQHSPQFFSTGAQERSASLGNMAFPSTSPFPMQNNDNPFYNNTNHSGAQLMGQQAFGHYQQPQLSPFMAAQQTGQSPSFFQQQQQQQQPPQFGNFATSMMPAAQPSASPWPQSQYANNQNMWN
jgi:hypothetical protein